MHLKLQWLKINEQELSSINIDFITVLWCFMPNKVKKSIYIDK